jgi:nicotinamide-nucleotide amidase
MKRETRVTDDLLWGLARRVGRRLRAARLSIATAESCTGGLIAKALTDIAGSSDYFERGWVTYSNGAKRAELDVAPRVLARHGAVSEAVALAMAAGALRRSGARVSIAVTGIAGPGGGTAGKPVGLVWIAWGFQRRGGMQLFARRFRFRGGRDAVRRQAAAAALEGQPGAP